MPASMTPHAAHHPQPYRLGDRQALPREVVHAIASLDHRQADPVLLAGWLAHCTIANRVRHVRDITHGEGVSRIPARN